MANKRKVRKEIIEAKDRLKTWEAVNDELFDGKMNLETLRIIATSKNGYFPVDKEIVDILCPPKPKSDYRLRPVQCLCTKTEYDAMLKYSTRERMIRALDQQKPPLS